MWEIPTFRSYTLGARDPAVYKKNSKVALKYKDPAVQRHVAGIQNMRSDSPDFRSLDPYFDDVFNNDAYPELSMI